MSKPYLSQLRGQHAQSGVYQDKLIHLREATSTPSTLNQWVLTGITQETNLMTSTVRWRLNYMSSRMFLITLMQYRIGTTKTTNHIPGYNGYLPKTDLNPTAILQGTGEVARNTIIKQNIVENYQVRIPGYSGHNPMSVLNDRGSLRPNCLSTTGETFHW